MTSRITTLDHFVIAANHRNTVKQWKSWFNVPRAIAQQIQNIVTFGGTRKDAEAIAKAHYELTSQIGF